MIIFGDKLPPSTLAESNNTVLIIFNFKYFNDKLENIFQSFVIIDVLIVF